MRNILTLIFTSFLFNSAHADTFIVTSNADIGAGTLREAIGLANANGTAVIDYIHFNIADQSEAGRTINLQSELPTFTSKITIDGTTQSGSNLGISNARITLYLDHYTRLPFTFLFIQNATNVTIYGLCFKFFDNPNSGGGLHYAIGLRNASQITVGVAGKGNLFSGVREGISNNYWNYFTPDSVKNIVVQNNVFGLNSGNQVVKGGHINLRGAANITMGGPNLADGNLHISASISLTQINNSASEFFVKLENSRVSESVALSGNIADDSLTTKTWIRNCIFNGSGLGGLNLNQLFHRAIVQGNKFGLDATGNACQNSPYNIGVGASSKNVLIGGYTLAEQNIIHGDIYLNGQRHGVHILQNQISGIIANTAIAAPDPFLKITAYDNNLIKGVSNNNAKIQLYTTECPLNSSCLLKKYVAVTMADASGNWSFPYTTATPNLVATATIADSSTSAFTSVDIDHSNYRIIKHASCGKSNGSITGIRVYRGTHIKWYNNNILVSTDTSLVNVPAGTYFLYVSNGANGCIYSVGFTIVDYSPPLVLNPLPAITNASCGAANGRINHSTYFGFRNIWYNNLLDSIGNGSMVNNLLPGNYFLKLISETDSTCKKTYGPFVITNQSGPSLNTNNIQITPANCSNSNGSITGITVANATGTIFFKWLDSANNTVANTIDLVNIRPGKYRLQFKDETGCDTIVTGFYQVADIGKITIDTSNKLITASKCSGNTGSIQQLIINGAQNFTWTNTATNAVVGNSANVYNLPSGSYILSLSNSSGCSKASPVFFVPASTFLPITVTSFLLGDAVCNQNNGFAHTQSFSNNATLYSFSWRDSITGQIIGTGNNLNNLNAGIYLLFATDTNGCEKKIFSAAIKSLPIPTFNYLQVQIKPDNCSLNNGGISSLSLNNLKGPTVYAWYDQQQNLVGNTINLNSRGSGTYTLKITDAGFCNIQSTPFTISNNNNELPAPEYDDLIIPRFSTAGLLIRNPASGTYRLTDNGPALIVLANNDKGNFTIPNIKTDTSFFVKRIYGACESKAVKINIRVVDKSFFTIPNGFTPNGDGMNDRLNVRVAGFITLSNFTIYNKWGELVFQTSKLNTGWDGIYKGVLQNTGSYIWLAAGKDINGNIIKDRGSFILIR